MNVFYKISILVMLICSVASYAQAVPVQLLTQEYSIGGIITGLFNVGDMDDPNWEPTALNHDYGGNSTTEPLSDKVFHSSMHGDDPYSKSSVGCFNLNVETGGHDDFGNTFGEAFAEATWVFEALGDFNAIDLEYYTDFWGSVQIRLTDLSLGATIFDDSIGLGEGFGANSANILYNFAQGNDYELYFYGLANQWDDGPNCARISSSNLEITGTPIAVPEPEIGFLLLAGFIGLVALRAKCLL